MVKLAGFIGSILMFAAVLNAGSVTYSYTGDDFTSYSGAYNSGAETNITVSVTLASALGDNFSGDVTPLSFQFSDGSNVLTDQSPNIDNGQTAFDFVTDGSGNITGWDVSANQINASESMRLLTESGVDDTEECGGSSDLSVCSPELADADVEYAGNQPSFTVGAAAPEPSTISLAVIGALLVLIGRRLKSGSGLSR
jgi:hypothetical protein